jgi:hypothetical protein
MTYYEADDTTSPASRDGHWLTRFYLLRLLGLVYLVAFLILALQGPALIGHHGITPADVLLERLADHYGSRWDGFLERPTLFWLGCSDGALQAVAWTGVALSAALLAGYANALSMLLLWLLYSSLVRVGQVWTGFGWDIQLMETGFLGIFLCPLLDPRPFPRRPPPVAVIWMFRWLIVRIMLGSGLIKLRGDECWRALTCLDFHFETQPNPHPLSPLFHFLPTWAHRAGVLFNHLAELVAPLFLFGPRRLRHLAAAVVVAFQVSLILSGNLAFLNWLTLVPALACIDDSMWQRLSPRRLREAAGRAATASAAEGRTPWARHAVVGLLGLVVGLLSLQVVVNLISREQRMNSTFDRLGLVNTYGAFGSVGNERPELVFEGTLDTAITRDTVWRTYEFPCKPTDVNRRPCLITPYHLRLDWQLWFAALSRAEREPWAVHLVWKLLHADPGVRGLLAHDPFGGQRPAHVRVDLYQYRFAPLSDRAYWQRTRLGTWLPPFSAEDARLRRYLQNHGFLPDDGSDPDPAGAAR